MKRPGTVIIFISLFYFGCMQDLFDFTTLRVIDCSPSNHRYGVQEDSRVIIEFNNDVKKKDLEKIFSLSSESDTVEGTFEWVSGKKCNYIPRHNLEIGSRYIIEIPRVLEDTRGNKMAMDFLSDFYVGVDLVKPTVLSTVPPYTEGGAMDVPIDQNIVVTFSKRMNENLTESLFSLSPGASGYFTWNAGGTQLTYLLTADLEYGVPYTLTIPSGVEDVYGNALDSSYRVVFITGSDFIIPHVKGVSIGGAPVPPYWDPDTINTNASRFESITAYFSESMNMVPTESAFSIIPSVDGTFTWNADTTTMTFSPVDLLDPETIYTIRIGNGAEDINGLNMQDEYRVRFQTDAIDSLYIRVGDVYGSDEDLHPYNFLFSGSPAEWPVRIEMGPSGEYDYYFTIQFINDNGVVVMSPYSIFDNVLLEGFNPDFKPLIDDISWKSDYGECTIVLAGLSNDLDLDSGEEPVLYRLTVIGGKRGVCDAHGNTMRENFIFEFRE